ncbi:hypothetical protein CCACVL1_08406 [Corchorus capsularis]|uniref:Uncharacterized protein n=1 Tax=Corchorus capsularis TaxID=210143 RepID=A0A1R3J0V3_COCAP|nr:hypothetical protein CCACVL1_08406 [Corchorus capsularis]
MDFDAMIDSKDQEKFDEIALGFDFWMRALTRKIVPFLAAPSVEDTTLQKGDLD